jgi:hypothetical protein
VAVVAVETVPLVVELAVAELVDFFLEILVY